MIHLGIRKRFDGADGADLSPSCSLTLIWDVFVLTESNVFSSAHLPVVHVAHERRILPRVENR